MCLVKTIYESIIDKQNIHLSVNFIKYKNRKKKHNITVQWWHTMGNGSKTNFIEDFIPIAKTRKCVFNN